MNCSSTTVNRSWRARPSCTAAWLGAVAAGFDFLDAWAVDFDFDPNDPDGGDFNAFDAGDRFNFNGPGYNYLRTPNERVNLYTNVTHELSDQVDMFIRASYTNRESATKAAPSTRTPQWISTGSSA